MAHSTLQDLTSLQHVGTYRITPRDDSDGKATTEEGDSWEFHSLFVSPRQQVTEHDISKLPREFEGSIFLLVCPEETSIQCSNESLAALGNFVVLSANYLIFEQKKWEKEMTKETLINAPYITVSDAISMVLSAYNMEAEKIQVVKEPQFPKEDEIKSSIAKAGLRNRTVSSYMSVMKAFFQYLGHKSFPPGWVLLELEQVLAKYIKETSPFSSHQKLLKGDRVRSLIRKHLAESVDTEVGDGHVAGTRAVTASRARTTLPLVRTKPATI
ncbi:hypothetical protein LEL_10533 [Akanthomyces lecanii RCEF 1005]|uniref:Uncharacterized protein n=1 Tax=Akanthomyces lecanii RCEF 1005 TaxID=1081108 RepID=A0A167XKI1_CORDF|nr:hypothetical protein LEL_10533 [Akanthomyces lecanii RCEF 1005]